MHAPDKVGNINTIVEQFKYKKNELWALLEQKYDLAPGSALAFIQGEDEFGNGGNSGGGGSGSSSGGGDSGYSAVTTGAGDIR
jgi:hypothetical protein